MNFTDYQKEAEKLAKEAGDILQEYRQKLNIKRRKFDYLDIVTDADLASERFIIHQIRKKFSEHAIFSEEFGEEIKRSDFVWIIDPLDGTKEFARNLPIYNVSIALEYKQDTVVGIVYRPATSELFSAAKNNGAYLSSKRIQVSAESSLANSFIWTHLPSYKTSRREFDYSWNVLKKIARDCYRLRPFAEDVTSLCWLAMGALEGYLMTMSTEKWWDVAPGLLMVEEAGGKVTDMQGQRIKNRNLSKGIVASNGKIHHELLKYLKER